MPFHLWPARGPATRREFLAALTLGGAGAVTLSGSTPRRESRGPWFALVSDTHIPADPKHKALGQDPTDNLRVVVADILAQPDRPAGVVIDGDLALKEGRPGDYATLLAAIEPLRRAGIPLHFGLGNHDDRAGFREAVAGVVGVETEVEEKHVGTFEALGARFVVLDSLDKVNATPGRLGETQLAWLRRDLDGHRDRPALVFVHHNPRSTKRHATGLLDGEALLGLFESRPWVRALVFGHTHHWSIAREGGLDLVNLPAVAYSFQPGQPLGYCRLAIDGGRPEFELRDVVRKAEAERKSSAP